MMLLMWPNLIQNRVRQLDKEAYQNELLFEGMDDRILVLEKANSVKEDVISQLQLILQDLH